MYPKIIITYFDNHRIVEYGKKSKKFEGERFLSFHLHILIFVFLQILVKKPNAKLSIKTATDHLYITDFYCPIHREMTDKSANNTMKELEQRISAFKHQENAIIFPAGYSANLGFVSSLVSDEDLIIFDELSHASFYDALRLTDALSIRFKHNDLDDLEHILAKYSGLVKGRIWVCVEGVYSMDGDLAPLAEIVPMIKKYGAYIMLDDAHGTGVLGNQGSGTAEYFGVSSEIDVSMGTFSKSLAVTGGFLSGSKEIVNYMRYFARPYMFSASLPPMTLAAILAGLDVIRNEPRLRYDLHENVRFANKILTFHGFESRSKSPVISLIVPEWMNLRRANALIHRQGIFLNAIEYPAVPKDKQRFRISLMAEHTKDDIRKLGEVLDSVWNDERVRYD